MEEDLEPKDEAGVDGRGGFAGGMGGCVIWVRLASHRFSSWYKGPGLSLWLLPTFVLVSRMHLSQQYRDNDHFLNTVSSSRRETMVGGALARDSDLSVGLGVGGVTIVSGSCDHSSHSWISLLLTSSLSLGISSLFCRVSQCM
jgi:hypothetical protein